MPDEKRYGAQTPTISVTLPYDHTEGKCAIEFYEQSGNKAQPWQSLLIYDIMAIDKDLLYVHQSFGFSVPRRNGKGEILTIRELYGLSKGEHIMHTAHLANTSSSASSRVSRLLKKMGYYEVLRPRPDQEYPGGYVYSKQRGLERITLLDTGGVCEFRTRTSSGGLGEGFDLLIIDEAQEYTNDQRNTLQYTVSDSKNPQIIMCGTPPTAVSKGTVFEQTRKDILSGENKDTGWAEWSVPALSDVNDMDVVYDTNPAMGYQLNERKVQKENSSDKLDYNIQRFGYWSQTNLKSAISADEWSRCITDQVPTGQNPCFVSVKYGKDGENVSMAIATKIFDFEDPDTFVEVIDCRPVAYGTAWIIQTLKRLNYYDGCVDGARGSILNDELEKEDIEPLKVLPTNEFVKANAIFEQSIKDMTFHHSDQPSLTQAVTNCGKRTIGQNGGFGYMSIKEGVDISLLDAAMLAHYMCSIAKIDEQQIIEF